MMFRSSVLAAALAAAIGAPAAAGAVTLTPTAGGGYTGSFSSTVNGLFIDNLDFTPASIGGLVSVTLSSLSGPVSFFTATLNDQNFSFFPENGSITNVSFSTTFASAGPLALTVFGAAMDVDSNFLAGSYRGTVTVAALPAVPEPGTWALLALGLGALGLAARGRQRA